MSIVYTWDPRSQCTYVYEQESHYDPITKQSRPKRTYLGRLDPETGTYSKVGKRGRRSKSSEPISGNDAGSSESGSRESALIQENQELKKELDQLRKQQKMILESLQSLINRLN